MYKNMCSKAFGLLVIFSLFLVACSPNAPAETELYYSLHFDYPDRPSYVINAHEYLDMPDAVVPNRGAVVVKQLGGLILRSRGVVEAQLICNFHISAGSELLLYQWDILEGNIIIYDYVVERDPPDDISDTDLVSEAEDPHISEEDTGTYVSHKITLETTYHDVRNYKCEAFLTNHDYGANNVQLAFGPPRLRILVHAGEEDDLDSLIDSLTNAIPIRASLGAEDRILSEAPNGSYTIIGEITFPQEGAFFTLKHNGHELDATIQKVDDDQGRIVSNDPVEFSTGDEIILEVKEGACNEDDAGGIAAWNMTCSEIDEGNATTYTLTY